MQVLKHLPTVSVVILLLAGAGPCAAGTVSVIQALNFGKWYVSSNSGDYTVSIDADGNYSNSPQFIMLQAPTYGIYDISGLPVSTAITSVVVTEVASLQSGGSEEFTMDGFDVDYPASTDGSGNATIEVGAVAHTSGSGNGYGNQVYTGTLNIEINY